MPQRLERPIDVLSYEIAQEQAAALGRLGRRLEQALTKLRSFDSIYSGPNAGSISFADRQRRHALVVEAGHTLWLFVVQREACGLRDSRTLMRDYQVPREVEFHMGTFPAATLS